MPRKSVLREYFEALLIAVVLATFARTWVVQAFKIPSGSMEENLLVGDHLLVNKFVFGAGAGEAGGWLPMRPLRRGDVVVFKFPEDPERDFIKRCVGLPGDVVELVDKTLRVNGRTVEDRGYTYHRDPRTYPRSAFLSPSFRFRDNFGPYEVPPDSYFCLGDNRDNSNDSRFWGPVPRELVKGRAFMIYWSFESSSLGTEWPGAWSRVKQLSEVLARFLSHTRWERSFRIVT